CSATLRNPSASHSNRLPNFASQIRTAFASMAWNTGSSSPGELEITLNTSDVAVCWARDSRSSFSSRALSIAITACSRESGDQLGLLVCERVNFIAVKCEDSDRCPIAQQRHTK